MKTQENVGSTKKIIRLRQVLAKTGQSRSGLYSAVSKGAFPSPVKLSERCVGWLDDEVDAWIESRVRTSKRGA